MAYRLKVSSGTHIHSSGRGHLEPSNRWNGKRTLIDPFCNHSGHVDVDYTAWKDLDAICWRCSDIDQNALSGLVSLCWLIDRMHKFDGKSFIYIHLPRFAERYIDPIR